MVSDKSRAGKLLRAIHDIDLKQLECIRDKRVEELLENQLVRDDLFNELRSIDAQVLKDPELKELSARIVELDSTVASGVESMLSGLKGTLAKLKSTSRVVKAYSASF